MQPHHAYSPEAPLCFWSHPRCKIGYTLPCVVLRCFLRLIPPALTAKTPAQRFRIVDGDPALFVHRDVAALFVRGDHAVDALARGADEAGQVALREPERDQRLAASHRPAVEFGE